jgi:hypothetical protein
MPLAFSLVFLLLFLNSCLRINYETPVSQDGVVALCCLAIQISEVNLEQTACCFSLCPPLFSLLLEEYVEGNFS